MKNDLIAIRKKLDALKYTEEPASEKSELIEKIERDFYKALESHYMASPLLQRVKLACFIRQVADNIAPGEICTSVDEYWNGKDKEGFPVVVISAVYKPAQEGIAVWKIDLAKNTPPIIVPATKIVEKINKGLGKLKID